MAGEGQSSISISSEAFEELRKRKLLAEVAAGNSISWGDFLLRSTDYLVALVGSGKDGQ